MKNFSTRRIASWTTSAFIMFVVLGCPNPNTEADKFVGTWSGPTVKKEVLTTHSDETAAVPYSEGIGSLSVTGQINANLNYFNSYDYNSEEGLSISISNFSLYDTTIRQGCGLSINVSPDGGESIGTLVVVNDIDDYTFYYGETVDFSFDSSSYTLTINSTEFFQGDEWGGSIDLSSAVTVSGVIQRPTMEIKSNTPTQIGGGNPYYYTLLEIRDDGNFQMKWRSPFAGYLFTYDLIIDSKWEADGDNLSLTIDEDQWVMTYLDDCLIRESESDPCEMYGTQDACLRSYEDDYMLDPGSLDAVLEILEAVLCKLP